ncbi:MAG: metallophosphoesterase [Spirochaetes bacterium]|jgi:predicted phosphodiesterase|nr:metallophosphoesterase [Spirochaetota bacterium]
MDKADMVQNKNGKFRFAVMSDIHCEFHRDNGKLFINDLYPDDLDVLVLAGDINIAKNGLLIDSLGMFCNKFKNQKIVYVHGNHEFYGTDRESALKTTAEAVERNPNLIWLENDIAEIKGRRFLGTPLWFSNDPENIKHEKNLADFSQIKNFREWVYVENKKSIDFLKKEIKPGDIVITHHLPTRKSIPPQFTNSTLNRFFVCDVENIITKKMPAMWIHGHTHSSNDYKMGESRIICNPFGYAAVEENSKFKGRKTITL